MCSSKDGDIILCDTDVTHGDHMLKVGESLQGPHTLPSKVCLQISLSKVFAMFLLQVSGHSSSSKSFGLWF